VRTKLFQFESDEIKVLVEAYFENGDLLIDGYDIGERVKEFWGDSDYEYTTRVVAASLPALYAALGISGDQQFLLLTLADRFHDNDCYSKIQKFLEDHKVPYSGWSWA